MTKDRVLKEIKWLLEITVATILFGLGFDLFLEPGNINCGGVSGMAMIIKELIGRDTMFGFGTIAVVSLLLNIPLFLVGFKAIGRRFFVGSLLGTVLSSVFMQLFLPLETIFVNNGDKLLYAIFGGVVIGVALGIAFVAGASTGGSDIAARLLKLKFRNFPIGKLTLSVDIVVILFTGLVYRDYTNTLYSAVTLYVSSITIDAVVYRFDYSKAVIVISDKYEEIAKAIDEKLCRGVTMLKAQGYFKRSDKYVLLSAVKRQQLEDMKSTVNEIDKNAFIIVCEAHQVLGDGFKRYSDKSL